MEIGPVETESGDRPSRLPDLDRYARIEKRNTNLSLGVDMSISIPKAAKFGLIAAITTAGAVSLAPAASADVTTFTHASCTTGSESFPAFLSVHPAKAFNPLFVTDPSTGARIGVLVPQSISLNGALVYSKASGLDKSNVTLSTCSFTSSLGTFEITGIIAPPAT